MTSIAISDDVGDEFANGFGVTLTGRALALRVGPCFTVPPVPASIADAKKNPSAGTERGDVAVGDTGVGTQHRNAFSSASPLEGLAR